ncbi:hypothetical protein HPB50_024790 [Hyalomma asiaticum]|uniref:Uncharacterized protein n=1 Tax=Hyalomma asiaticum TaxID=266040 RepID=A0ACB7T957_HYAAI|nr:hypothetical protein HPB50_024790 [Hyalomma asiaticum]
MPVFGTLSPQFDDTQWMTSWLGALEETRTLRELRICLLGMTDAQCRSLFLGIAGSDTLDHVVFEDVADCLNLETLSKLIQNFGIGDRVRFRHLSITHQNSPVLSKVTALSSLTFNSLGVQLHSWYPMEHLLNCCKTVSRRGTKMTLNVHCDLMRQSAFGDLLSWLAQSSTLTDVAIDCFNHADTYRCEECADMCSKLVSAVASNGNITGVTLVSLRLEAEHLNMLCESARMYRRLTEISVLPACVDFKACVREKQRRWTEGYHAATVQLQYVVHQNASRIGPAVRFVLGRDITAEEAIALEDLYDHPRVLERVRHEARVTNAEAAAMVKRAAAKLRNMNVHYYMWLAGVVKKRQAVRLDRDSQEVHILDLPLECWIHIRRYLKIADVASARPRLA